MAKIAVIFLLFALFAITMGASVPEQSNPSKDFVDGVNQGLENIIKLVQENINEEKLKELQEKFAEVNKKVVNAVKEGSKNLNQNIQKVQA